MTRNFTSTLTIIALICTAVVSSCKKDSPAIQKEKTKTELISEKSWRLTALEYNTEATGGTFTSTSVSRDASYVFTADHKYTQTSPHDGLMESGSWSFNGTETEITLIVAQVGSPAVTVTGSLTLTADKLAILIAGDFTDINSTGEFVNYKQKRLIFTH